MRRVLISALVALTIAELPGVAVADPTAEDHFDAGYAAFNRGDFPTAVREWQASFQISGETSLIFNIAQAQRLSGNCPRALAAYRSYLTIDSIVDQRALAEGFVRELEARCGAPRVPDPTSVAAQATAGKQPEAGDLHDHEEGRGRRGQALRIAGLATSGTGVAALTTGLLLGHHAASIGDQVTSACRTSCDWATWRGQDAAGKRDAAIGEVLDVAGIVGIAGGAALYYLGLREGSVGVAPRPREGGAVVTWSGTW